MFKKHSNFGVSYCMSSDKSCSEATTRLTGLYLHTGLFQDLHDDFDNMSFQHNYYANHIFSLLVVSLFTIEIGW